MEVIWIGVGKGEGGKEMGGNKRRQRREGAGGGSGEMMGEGG